MGGKSSAPPAPDYRGAAQATAAGNLDAARATAAANRVNQVTPYGNLTYSIDGKDSFGNDLYTATQTLNPSQQAILDQQNKLNTGLLSTANSGLNYANNILSKPGVDTSKLPGVGINPGQSYQDAMMSRLQPQIDRENNALDAQLANQGITMGSEAWNNAKRQMAQQHNDLLNNATVQGFNTGLAANQNAFQQTAYNQMQPINVINALRTGSQVTNPNFVNVPQQATTSGPDYLGATQATYQANLNAANASNAANAGLANGLFSLGGSLGSAALFASDPAIKQNVKKIGRNERLGLNIYEYEYKPEFKKTWGDGVFIGVMADEVQEIMPDAVYKHPDGYLMVDYGRLL